MRKGSAALLIILIVLGSIVAGAVGMFYFTEVFKKTDTDPAVSSPTNIPETNSSSKTPLNGELANFQAYSNSKFSLSYPSDWEILDQNMYSPQYPSVSIAPKWRKNIKYETSEDTIIIGVSPNPKNLAITDIVEKPYSQTGSCCLSGQYLVDLGEWKNIQIDGTEAKKVITKAGLQGSTYAYISKNNEVYWFAASTQNSEILKTFDQILTVFKFK